MATVLKLLKLEEVTYTMLLDTDGNIDKRANEIAVYAIGAQAEADTQLLALQRYLEARNSKRVGT